MIKRNEMKKKHKINRRTATIAQLQLAIIKWLFVFNCVCVCYVRLYLGRARIRTFKGNSFGHNHFQIAIQSKYRKSHLEHHRAARIIDSIWTFFHRVK